MTPPGGRECTQPNMTQNCFSHQLYFIRKVDNIQQDPSLLPLRTLQRSQSPCVKLPRCEEHVQQICSFVTLGKVNLEVKTNQRRCEPVKLNEVSQFKHYITWTKNLRQG